MIKLDSSIYCIRGTGSKIDGMLVNVLSTTEVHGVIYYSVHPINLEGFGRDSILIHSKYLSKIRDSLTKIFTYKITVEKIDSDGNSNTEVGQVSTTLKNFNLKDIVSTVCSNLMEI